ncbi:glycosyltransferase family 4 protein [Thermoleptolyngbya sp. C42_A2020_037]|uniref:glycosyltransferase family 4 protein n=1 Tax=Thermoleptolyngbya sp. C42_A2020_037 TaxID=2747799 RepID=UPI0019E294D1|nr:glycosyltransferase family 4 protein [Thermoleptolyngbya sp. C42_A2020_037]MBF2085953.1 glycosyltransferase [Thermoleptolyngbya sp. C42_A2020_037]
MRILMLSSTFPYPPTRGGTEVRTFHLLRWLAQRHEVTLLTQRVNATGSEVLAEGAETRTSADADLAALEALGARVLCFPLGRFAKQSLREWPQGNFPGGSFRNSLGKLMRLGRSHLWGIPPNVDFRHSPALQAWVDDAVQQRRFDVLTCEHGANAVYVRPEFQRRVRTVLNAHSFAVGWTRAELALGVSANPWRDRLYLPTIERYERRFRQQFSRVVVTTAEDRQQFLDFLSGPDFAAANADPDWVQVVPNGIDLAAFLPRVADPGGYRLVFAGAMDAPHNIDAVYFFVEAVLPLVRSRYSEVTFCIAGARPTAAVQALAQHPGVQVMGAVAEMGAVLREATGCVLPLRLGFGIKNKTLEAMAVGVPIVGSDRALEGLPIEAAEPLALRANTPTEYAGAIARLFDSPTLRQQLSQRARTLVETHYTWETVGQQYERALMEPSPVIEPWHP